MIRKLLIVAASALVLAIATLSAAWVMGGKEIAAHLERDGELIIGDDDNTPEASRTLAFDPAQALRIDLPVKLQFRKGDKPEMTVSGRQAVLDRLSWQDGVLGYSGKGVRRGGVQVTIVAPTMPALTIRAAGEVDLEGIDQPELRIALDGAGNVEARGKVERVFATSSGAGNLDLAGLSATDATIEIAGVGNAEVNASGTVDAEISGAGNITLKRKPATLNSRIHGIGSVDHDY